MSQTFYPGGREIAASFLSTLDPNNNRVWHGCQIGITPRQAKGMANRLMDSWTAQTNTYVHPNPGGHKDADITSISAVWLDFDAKAFLSPGIIWDSATAEQREDARALAQQALKLAHQGDTDSIVEGWPLGSIIVQSGHGWHLYWLVKDCPVERFKSIQHALAKQFSGDHAVCNPSRLMRLPGTWNCKDKPVQVTMPLCKPERVYALAELLKGLGVEITTLDIATGSPDNFGGKPDTPTQRKELASALEALDPGMGRADWLKVCCSVVAHGYPDAADLAIAWSAASGKFDTKARTDIEGLKVDGGVSADTVYWMARQSGWRPESDCPDPNTDDGLACRFVTWLDGRAMHARGVWHVWSGAHWRPSLNAAERLLKEFAGLHHKECTNAYGAALRTGDDAKAKVAKRILVSATRLLDQRKQIDVLRAAATMLWVDGIDLDTYPDLLPVPNGAIDLRTGVLLPPDSSRLFTRIAGTDYVPDAAAPRFKQFLTEILPDSDERDYVQRWAGYCLSGQVREEVMAVWHGSGSNGKSQLLNVIEEVMGSFAQSAEPSLLVGKSANTGQASPDVAALAGCRLAFVNESAQRDKLNGGQVKRLVSTEKLSARRLYGEPFTFSPTAKILLRTNHRPDFEDSGDGMWRRLHLLPFCQSFTGEQRDDTLADKLRGELPGVLAWAVQGAVQWYRQGLNPPPTVRAATTAYKSENDHLGEWVAVRVEEGGFTPTSMLLHDYASYAGLRLPPTAKTFNAMLATKGFKPMRTASANGFKLSIRADDFD